MATITTHHRNVPTTRVFHTYVWQFMFSGSTTDVSKYIFTGSTWYPRIRRTTKKKQTRKVVSRRRCVRSIYEQSMYSTQYRLTKREPVQTNEKKKDLDPQQTTRAEPHQLRFNHTAGPENLELTSPAAPNLPPPREKEPLTLPHYIARACVGMDGVHDVKAQESNPIRVHSRLRGPALFPGNETQ